jgi:hypothetical protein
MWSWKTHISRKWMWPLMKITKITSRLKILHPGGLLQSLIFTKMLIANQGISDPHSIMWAASCAAMPSFHSCAKMGQRSVMLISCHYWNKLPQTGWSKIICISFLMVLESRSQKSLLWNRNQDFLRIPLSFPWIHQLQGAAEPVVTLLQFLFLSSHHLFFCVCSDILSLSLIRTLNNCI